MNETELHQRRDQVRHDCGPLAGKIRIGDDGYWIACRVCTLAERNAYAPWSTGIHTPQGSTSKPQKEALAVWAVHLRQRHPETDAPVLHMTDLPFTDAAGAVAFAKQQKRDRKQQKVLDRERGLREMLESMTPRSGDA